MNHKALTFSIPYSQILTENSTIQGALPDWATAEKLIELYEAMTASRLFDQKSINLQRTGLIRTYPPSIGQEAVFAAIAAAMEQHDILAPHYRDHAAFLARGILPEEIWRYWGGYEDSNCYQNPDRAFDLPICVPISTQCLHAVGIAYAQQYQQTNKVVVCTIGDGGTSQGDFYEALNAAAHWQLPIIFVINNNQWAISIPSSEQTAAESFAQKAIAAGMQGYIVDGNDVIGAVDIMQQVVHAARSGGGPALVEAQTYRLCDHTTADDATRYRDENEYEEAKKKEPIKRLQQYLLTAGILTKQQNEQIQTALKQIMQQAAERFLTLPAEPAGENWNHLFHTLPIQYQEQKAAWIKKAMAKQNAGSQHE